MSGAKKEYEMLKGLLNGTQVGTLDSAILLDCVQQQTLSQLGNKPLNSR
jgi:hypothetical protein